jgi:predicted metal-dependent phosphoesterase TrpH
LQLKSWKDKVDAYLSGYRSAREEGQKIGITVLLGMELRFDENYNDYLVYGFDESFLLDYKELYNMGLKKFKSFARKNNLLIYQAHPFRSWVTPANPAYLDGVEVFNGNPRHDSNNQLALTFARKNKLKMLSGSDFHQKEDLALGGIVLSEVPSSSSELVHLLNDNGIVELLPEKQGDGSIPLKN